MNNFFLIANPVFRLSLITVIVFGAMLVCAPAKLIASPPDVIPRDIKLQENSLHDTIIAPLPLRQRLDDPNYDTRFERGALQPWHDTKSIYLRRTIPLSQLAALRLPDTV